MAAGGFNFGFGLSFGSAGGGAGNIAFGVSINSQGVSVGTVSGGVVVNSQGVSVGTASLGAGANNTSAAAGTAGVGAGHDNVTASTLTAGAGTAQNVTGTSVLQAGSGDVDGSQTPADGGGQTPSPDGGQGGGGGAGQDPSADGGQGGGGGAGQGMGPDAGVDGGQGGGGGAGQGMGPDAGVDGGQGGGGGAGSGLGPDAGVDGGQGPDPQGGQVDPSANPPVSPRLQVPGLTAAQEAELIAEAARIEFTLNNATPAQQAFFRQLIQQNPTGTYMIPQAQWIDRMIFATQGLTDAQIAVVARLDWTPGHVSRDELRRRVQASLHPHPPRPANPTTPPPTTPPPTTQTPTTPPPTTQTPTTPPPTTQTPTPATPRPQTPSTPTTPEPATPNNLADDPWFAGHLFVKDRTTNRFAVETTELQRLQVSGYRLSYFNGGLIANFTRLTARVEDRQLDGRAVQVITLRVGIRVIEVDNNIPNYFVGDTFESTSNPMVWEPAARTFRGEIVKPGYAIAAEQLVQVQSGTLALRPGVQGSTRNLRSFSGEILSLTNISPVSGGSPGAFNATVNVRATAIHVPGDANRGLPSGDIVSIHVGETIPINISIGGE